MARDGKRHTGRKIGLAVLLIIILGGIAFYFAYLSGGIGTPAYHAATNSSSLKTALLQKIDSYPQLGINYIGSIGYNVNLGGADPVIAVPINVSFLKYMNDERVSFSVGALPVGGFGAYSNISAVGISIDNGSTVYACYRHASGPYSCFAATGSPTQIFNNITNALNLSALSGFHLGIPTPSIYNGMPCWKAAGNLTLYSTKGIFNGTAFVSYNTCISPTYYIPLVLNANITTSTNQFAVNLYVRNITQATSESEVTALPGPLVNVT